MNRPFSIATLLLVACWFELTAGLAYGQAGPGVDLYGDPLPPGALARLGSERLRHPNYVFAVTFTPDGKTVASMGQDGFIRLWDAATGKEIRHFGGEDFTLTGSE